MDRASRATHPERLRKIPPSIERQQEGGGSILTTCDRPTKNGLSKGISMKSLLLMLLIIGSTISAFGQMQIVTVPHTPLEGEEFTVRISGVWRDSCVPDDPTMFLTGDRIIPTFTLPARACLPATTPFESEVVIPGRQRGYHQILVRLLDFDGKVVPLAQGTVEIAASGIRPLQIVWPDFGVPHRRNHVRVNGNFACQGCGPVRVFFGDLEAEEVQFESDSLITAFTPLSGKFDEVVDVVIRRGTEEWRRPGGFRFLALDEFEAVLVPIWYLGEIPGANGSRWEASFLIHNGHQVPLLPNADILSIDTYCPVTCPEFVLRVGRSTSPLLEVSNESPFPSAILHVHRTLVQNVAFQARTRDLSRQGSTWGTEVPVVRKSEIVPYATVRLLDVPVEDDFRVMLRLYGIVDGGAAVVRIFDSLSGDLLHEETVMLSTPASSLDPWSFHPKQPAYAQIPNLQDREELKEVDRVRIEMYGTAGMLWGMASVTHFDSQHVTLVTPQ